MRPSWPLSRHFQHIFLRFVVNFIDVIYRYNFRFTQSKFQFSNPTVSGTESPNQRVYFSLHSKCNDYGLYDAISRHFCLFYDCFFCLFYLFCFNFVTSILFQFYHLNFVPISPSQFCSNFTNSQKYTIQ